MERPPSPATPCLAARLLTYARRRTPPRIAPCAPRTHLHRPSRLTQAPARTLSRISAWATKRGCRGITNLELPMYDATKTYPNTGERGNSTIQAVEMEIDKTGLEHYPGL